MPQEVQVTYSPKQTSTWAHWGLGVTASVEELLGAGQGKHQDRLGKSGWDKWSGSSTKNSKEK